MRRYPIYGVEHVHMMRCMPRSYDMSRTHIMHKSINQHVDVVLRCSPKYWKKKKVRVRVIESVKKNNCIKIRVSAKKEYVAVRKVVNEKYEKDRKNVSSFNAAKVVRYNKASVANKALIHDMKSQLTIMARKSADYIDNQLAAKSHTDVSMPSEPMPVRSVVSEKTAESHMAQTEPLISNEVEDILKKGGYKRSKFVSEDNPYASDYSKHVSNEEFLSLMESLEKSLDEACSKCNIKFDQSESEAKNKKPCEFTQSDDSGYLQSNDFSLSVTNTSSEPNFSHEGNFEPVPIKRNSDGEFTFYENKEAPEPVSALQKEYDSFEFSPVPPEAKDEYKPVIVSPKEEEEYKPVTVSPEEEEEYKPVTVFPKEEEEYKPVTVFPKEEEEYKPVTVFPEEEEEYKPVTVFPEEEEEYKPVTVFPEEETGEGYSPAPVSPDKYDGKFQSDEAIPRIDNSQYSNGYDNNDRQEYYNQDNRESETFFSRTGGQIKKVIGIIRGSASNLFSHRNNDDYDNDDVEITYSDRNDRY